MNTAVSESQFKGFSLRLRTASTGSYVLPPIYSHAYSTGDGEVTFSLSAQHAEALNEGQYYKLQIAYCAGQTVDGAGNVSGTDIGYYSTVGIAKCVSKPEVSIKGLVFENINSFNNEFFGFYDLSNCKDRTEKVYSYQFKVYDEQENVYYDSGERLHQAYYDTDYLSSLDRIILNDFASSETIYSIEYTVTTLNGLVMSSPKYRVSSAYLVAPSNNINILPEADQEHGVINIHFRGETDPDHSYYYILDEELLNSIEVDEEGHPIVDNSNYTMIDKVKEVLHYYDGTDKLVYLRNNSLYKFYRYNTNTYHYQLLNNRLTNLVEINGKYYYKSDVQTYLDMELDIPDEALIGLDYYEKIISGKNLLKALTYGYVANNYIDLSKEYVISTGEHEEKYYGSYLLSRASDEDDYKTWFNIARFRLDDQIPSEVVIKDVTIEHGRKYKYALQQYNIWGLTSARIVSDIFEASFEDVFLYDGERSLRVRYNPTIDTFKTTILEQKTDTIGGKYPFITRNGATWYKEFPLGGLLAQEIDDMHYFVDPHYGDAHRHATSDKKDNAPDNAFLNYHDYSDTVIALERNFKLQVLDWLNDGKPKLFKSPYEGNYIIRLMNVSLTPVKELGRMLHSFTSQAYEIAECTYDNLVAFGFIKPSTPSDLIGLWKTYDLTDPSLRDGNGDIIIEFEHGVQNFTIQDLMPGDIIYLSFANQDEELPIMIGITGSYSYEGISDNLVKIRIPQPEDHELTGKIDAFYTGMRVTDFDSIINMMLKTIISQQYVGTSPWMQRLKLTNWLATNNYNQYWQALQRGDYNELQNYNFRTYLDQVVESNGHGSYSPTENFAKLAWSFDPGELLDRINLTINKGEKYKTELLNMEMMRFRERPLIPVYTYMKSTNRPSALYVPGEYQSLLEPKKKSAGDSQLLVATSPFGVPCPIEELQEYEMLDPFCIYQVFEYNPTIDNWEPYPGGGDDTCYYDPYYRSWMAEEYDPIVKMDYEWIQVAYLEDEIVGYCTQRHLDNFMNYNISITGDYWIGDNEEIKFDLSDDTVSTLRQEPNEDTGHILPVYRYTPNSEFLVKRNRIHQANKKKLERGEYIDQAINEKETFDYRLKESWTEANGTKHYYYENEQGPFEINSNKIGYELYNKLNDQYFVIGSHTVEPNTVYWVKHYKIQLNMTTEKMVEYKNIDLMNSYHIGNGVVAELTFQLRVIDYYTEIYDADVRRAKEAYLNAKQFSNDLMKAYNIIAKANLNININHGFMDLYDRLLKGNEENSGLSDTDSESVIKALSAANTKAELKLQSLYHITTMNTAFNTDILDLLIDYKDQNKNAEDLLAIFNDIEIYYYFDDYDQTDGYEICEKAWFEDEDNIHYLIDQSNDAELTDENTTVYKYSYRNETTYYYKVNKEKYINEYIANNHADADPEDLVVLYNVANDSRYDTFYVVDKNSLFANRSEIYELTKQQEDTTIEYLDLLNADELAALEIEDLFIHAEPEIELEFEQDDTEVELTLSNDQTEYYAEVSGKLTEIYPLYEEAEILTILSKHFLEGAANKLRDISTEINRIETKVNEAQSQYDTLKLTYLNTYKAMLEDINKYNEKIYKDWCGRVLCELFDDTVETKYCTQDTFNKFYNYSAQTYNDMAQNQNVVNEHYELLNKINTLKPQMEQLQTTIATNTANRAGLTTNRNQYNNLKNTANNSLNTTKALKQSKLSELTTLINRCIANKRNSQSQIAYATWSGWYSIENTGIWRLINANTIIGQDDGGKIKILPVQVSMSYHPFGNTAGGHITSSTSVQYQSNGGFIVALYNPIGQRQNSKNSSTLTKLHSIDIVKSFTRAEQNQIYDLVNTINGHIDTIASTSIRLTQYASIVNDLNYQINQLDIIIPQQQAEYNRLNNEYTNAVQRYNANTYQELTNLAERYEFIKNYNPNGACWTTKNDAYPHETINGQVQYFKLFLLITETEFQNSELFSNTSTGSKNIPIVRYTNAARSYTQANGNINYISNLYDESNTNIAKIIGHLVAAYKNVSSTTSVQISEENEELLDMFYSCNSLYNEIDANLPKIIVYSKMIADTQNNAMLDEYLQEQIAIEIGQVVLNFYALYEGIANIIIELNKNGLNNDGTEKPGAYLSASEFEECYNNCLTLIDKYNLIHEKIIYKESNEYKFKSEYADISTFRKQLRDDYLELYNTQVALGAQASNNNIQYNLQDIATLSNYQNDEEKLITWSLSNHPKINYGGKSVQPISARTSADLKGITADLACSTTLWYDPLNYFPKDKDNQPITNIFSDRIRGLSALQRTEVNKMKNKDNYWYRTGFEVVQFNDTNIPIRYFLFNPLDSKVIDPSFVGKYENNLQIFNSLTISQKNKVLALYTELSEILINILNRLPTNGGWSNVRTSLTNNYIKNPENVDQSLYTERASVIGLSNEGNNMSNIATVTNLIDIAKTYLINHKLDGIDYELTNINKTIGEIIPFAVGIDDQVDLFYGIPYTASSGNTVTYDATTGNYYKQVNLYTNWYQPIFLNETMKKENTEVITEESSNDIGQLDTQGIYYEYLQTFLEIVAIQNELLTQAENLQRLYQKQVDVYTYKYNKYAAEYETNFDIYSSYVGTEAFNYYNTVNNELVSDEVKEDTIQRYKAQVQEAWWNFINLLDARYSEEKERGMYV